MKKIIFITPLILLFVLSSCKTKQEVNAPVDSRESMEERGPRQAGDRQRPDGQRSPGQRPGRPSVDEVFKMDVNGDNLISKEEATGRIKENFARFDANGDGMISKEEFQNAPRPERGSRGRNN